MIRQDFEQTNQLEIDLDEVDLDDEYLQEIDPEEQSSEFVNTQKENVAQEIPASPDGSEKNAELHLKLAEYMKTHSIDLRNELVLDYSYIPKSVAAQMRGITSSYAQLEDIVNQGYITLIDCIEKYDAQRGMKFESYAFMRIKGANIDFVRKQDWLPRRVRKTSRDLNAAYDELASNLMREPTTKELAAHIGEDEEYVTRHYREMSNSVMLSFEMLLQSAVQEDGTGDTPASDDRLPEARLMRAELKKQLGMAIETLNDRERLVISLSYYEHLKLAEIADIIEVSEARVCQTRAKAILKMRKIMEAYMKG